MMDKVFWMLHIDTEIRNNSIMQDIPNAYCVSKFKKCCQNCVKIIPHLLKVKAVPFKIFSIPVQPIINLALNELNTRSLTF